MSFSERFFRRNKAPAPDPWEQTATAKIPLPVQDTRHYLADSAYLLPKDAEEDIRLDFQHYALFHALGNHYVAPLSAPLHLILDVGTGTGIWANEMARVFPGAVVVGIDLTARSFKPPTQANCLLRTGNVLAGLPFPDDFFSYTHQRLLAAGIPAANWPGVIHELVRVTRVNGWVELIEANNLAEGAGPATARVQEFFAAVGKSLGFDGDVIPRLGEMLKEEGLQGVEMLPIPIPVGEWAGRVGSMMKHNLLAATNALRGRYCVQAGITGAEFDQMIQAMVQEWEVFHPSCTFYATYGKRGEA